MNIYNLPNLLQTLIVTEALAKKFGIHLASNTHMKMCDARAYSIDQHMLSDENVTLDELRAFILHIVYENKGKNNTLVFIVGMEASRMLNTIGFDSGKEIRLLFKWFP